MAEDGGSRCCQPGKYATMSDNLANLVRKCSGTKVLLVGDLILDRYIYGDAERVSPEAPVPVLRTVEKKDAVGGSANVAACLSALGCEVSCCGCVGDDRHGKVLLDLLRENGIDVDGILKLSDRPTTTKTRLIGLAQHRHRQQLLRVDEEVTTPISEKDRATLESSIAARIQDADVICIEDYDKGIISQALVASIVTTAKKYNKTVMVDPARLTTYERYRGVHVLTPNRAELSIAVGRELATVEQVASAGADMISSIDAVFCVATVDREGAVLISQGGDWQHFPTSPRSVYDNTGAGDAVLAMLAAAIAAGGDMEEAVRLANIAGGLEVEKFGCVPIPVGEILAELRLEEGQRSGKLRSLEDLMSELTLRRDRGEMIAFTNGCFDILHAGHVGYLQRCRREASVLVLGLNSDESVRAQGKGDGRPFNNFDNRAAVLSALSCVDYVVGFDDVDPKSLIEKIRPDVLLKGEDWAEKGAVGADFVKSYGGQVVFVPLVEGLSTTNLVERIRSKEIIH